MSDVSGLRTAQTPQPHPERVELSSSAPTGDYGAPDLGLANARPAVDFPIWAIDDMARDPRGGAR